MKYDSDTKTIIWNHCTRKERALMVIRAGGDDKLVDKAVYNRWTTIQNSLSPSLKNEYENYSDPNRWLSVYLLQTVPQTTLLHLL